MDDPSQLPAMEYHERTKHSPRSVREGGHRMDFENKPTPYKSYRDREREALPDDPPTPSLPALEAITVTDPAPPTREPFPSGDAEDGATIDSEDGGAIDREGDDGTIDSEDGGNIDRETLGQLCHYAAGITKEIELRDRTVAFRAAACTGALYHVDLYPVCGDLEDLDDGVYHYDPRRQSLDVLRRGDHRGTLAAASGDVWVADAPVTVVATSTWWRNAWKYGERTFRHAFWDSGTVVANLLAAAHADGLAASTVLGFADGPVVDLLGLDPDEEAPLELVPIGEGAPVPEGEPIDVIDPATDPLSPNPIDFPAIPAVWRSGVLGEGDRVTGTDGEAPAEWRREAATTGPVGRRGPGDGPKTPLEPVGRERASGRPLGNTIVRRGSCREYDREAISFRKLSTVLDRAFRGAPLDVTADHDPVLSYNDAYLLVNGVEGLDSGVYHYHPDAGELELLRAGACRQEAGHLALDQPLGADAAVCCYFMTDLEAVTEALGDRGYRAAQFEAAVSAGRCYLATYAHRDLGGTGLTFYDDAVTEFLSPRASGQTPTFLYTLGRPA